jgi:hypothetical protein
MSEILARLASIYEDAGDLAAAVTALEQWLRLDVLNEEAHRRLLAAHLATGNSTAGLRAYEACRTVLAMELGSAPNLEIQALAEQLEATAHHPAAGPTSYRLDSELVLEPPLVGRAPELVTLRGCFARAQQGQVQVVVLSGESGIGKTHLARDFLATVRAQGGDVLQGQACELSASVPYAPVVEALRPRLEQENAPEDLVDDLWLAALTRVLPELGARYPDLSAAAAGCTEAQLFEAIVRLIQALAAQAPLVLFLDDAQWLDDATRELVQYALRRCAQCGARVLLLLAVRVEDVATSAALAAWLEHVARAAATTRLALGPLTPTATIRLVEALAGAESPEAQQAAGESAEARFGAWLAVETGGQPFFIVETLKALLQEGAVALRPDATRGWTLDVRGALRDPEGVQRLVPARVHEVIMTHVSRRSQAAVTLLVAGAVLGTRFTFEQVRHVADLSEREALASLDEAVRAHLLREDELGGYSFCYDMLRAVMSVQAGAARRQVFWRRACALLTDRMNTALGSDQGTTPDLALITTSSDAGGPLVRGEQVAHAQCGADPTSTARGLARLPVPAVLPPAGDQAPRLLRAYRTSITPIQHRLDPASQRGDLGTPGRVGAFVADRLGLTTPPPVTQGWAGRVPGIDPQRQRPIPPQRGSRSRQRRAPRAPPAQHPRRDGSAPAVS